MIVFLEVDAVIFIPDDVNAIQDNTIVALV